MRVLIINDKVHSGGAEVQTFREAALLREAGHHAKVLTFDGTFPETDTPEHRNLAIKVRPWTKVATRFIVVNRLARRIQKAIAEFSPDIIHINNSWHHGISVLSAARGVPIVQTIRDYYTVCPKKTAIDLDGNACSGYTDNDCRQRCGIGLKTQARLTMLRNYNRARQQTVGAFVTPSRALAASAAENGLPAIAIPNPFDFRLLAGGTPKRRGRRKFLYYGDVSVNKGLRNLLRAWAEFSAVHDDVVLKVVGRITSDFRTEFLEATRSFKSVEYLGVLSLNDIMSLYAEVYCVIVPSLWLENYPNTILEAQANRTLAIGADRGGIPELIDDPRWLFDARTSSEIASCLERAWLLPASEYDAIVAKFFDRVQRENSGDLYVARIITLFSRLLETHESNLR